jgi:hypothetical protein
MLISCETRHSRALSVVFTREDDEAQTTKLGEMITKRYFKSKKLRGNF